ncbi:hypothetical protein A3H77_01805 [Candidatus Kaiserbacteria bacterium RIFCSPLOWO2_02_FULL_56_11]|uniref:Phosphoribosyltransferase domain-containing protein n=2 Tax=Candidatus Kaiseribacteriota TaxID=1752734 RepID=A0A1F6E5F4_9BACT|nr:MAG: hypothetical protein A3C95_01490 [Candidatus Kaiserbacteria bacterium RIFCSPHIGHO2_02_FULL_56_30]OGG72012.1 MAG: hypothetical protein A3E65_01380 [Candidatus Kaiserbacteria bacterium RIFCSPHIGHO2_12_FULL_56_13]OGG82117.1 MAG: hypothetical protein A3H77_01805 [Candidatus Kaiserbacteria bacterium RIFCSPLOWO2_02_FULL_56_11]
MWARLLDFLFPLRTDEAIVRELSVDQFLSRLEPQLETRTNPPTVALLPFADRKVQAVIHEAKYHGSSKAFELLASALADYLRNDDRFDGLASAVLIPIPLGAKRRRERGFNQVEEVARRVGRELGISLVTDLLTRTRETVTQVTLPKAERAKNMRGAFAIPDSKVSLIYRTDFTYVVIDDVTTTGATLSAAISALKAAGAHDILPIALAH